MLEVIGAGFGRTGTHSLGRALEILGFGPCYNVLAVSKHPGHTKIWNKAIEGKSVAWDQLFAAYRSSVEWPAVAFLSEIRRDNPGAKIVLTMRDPQAWFESANATIFDGLELSAQNPDPIKRERSGMIRRLILEHTFAGRYREKEYAIEVYRNHNQQVIRTVPKELLLQFSVKDGWEPLCKFLEKPIPEETFPWLNERNEFMAAEPEWAKRIKSEQRNH